MKSTNPAPTRASMALLVTTLLSLHGFAHAEAELREFSNSEGKTIKARIVAASDQTVKLAVEGGREIEAGISYFSKADQDYITEWRKTNKPAIDYRFEIDYDKKRASRDTRREGPVEVTYETWLYKVEVENLSKVELSGLELHYKIYKTAKADAFEARYLAEGLTREGPYLVRKAKIDLKPVAHLTSVNAETETMPISKSELDPDYYYTDGDKSNKKDEMDGFWIKIFHEGKEVHELKSSHSALKSAKW